MAIRLQIPREYEEGLAKLGRLNDESAQELLAALQEVPATVNPSSLSSAVAAKVDTIAANDVEEMVPALLSLYTHRDYFQAAISDVVEGIAQALEENESERFRISSDERADFESRLADFLNVNRLDETARAGRLLLENEHSLREARVVTDIRPIFEPENPEAPPKGALLVHTLKISYLGDNRTKNFFVALDTNDVRELLEQLQRADAKAESLKSVLKAAGVSYIDAK